MTVNVPGLSNYEHTESIAATIPQPDLVKDKDHGLSSDQEFKRVKLDVESGRSIRGEYFPSYGDEGHLLLYFRGNENLPDFVDLILPAIKNLVAEKELITSKVLDSWRLTMNFYEAVSGVVSGFPFHVDIPANGVITMILNIHRAAKFQITDGTETVDLALPVGSLLILSGESRYKWKHRVLPGKSESKGAVVERISLVLGVK